jgi:hypothetical protein
MLRDTMIGIVKTLSAEEKKRLLQEDDFEDSLEYLEGAIQSYGIFKGIGDVLKLMKSNEDEGGSADEDEDDDGDSDSDDGEHRKCVLFEIQGISKQ